MQKFKTRLHSLSDFHKDLFLIPTYQRPYVWSNDEVEKMLTDFYAAFKRSERHYYLGTILVCNYEGKYELIDGQQRFTTLWLVSLAFQLLNPKSNITQFLKVESSIRFDFAIRIELKNYLESLLHINDINILKKRDDDIIKNEYVKNIHNIMVSLIDYLNTEINSIEIERFGNYIYSNVKFVVNETPKTNLNKLFATINSSGVQLSQTDLLKSNLLNKLKSDRVLYSKIWEACEHMNKYFESNVRALFTSTNWKEINKTDFRQYAPDKFKITTDNIEIDSKPIRSYTLEDILSKNIELNNSKEIEFKQGKEQCESIIDFPLLLLHTLRIFLCKNNKQDFNTTFHSSKLNVAFAEIFNDNIDKITLETMVKDFIKLLWEVRFVFDTKIVKWEQESEDSEKMLLLSNLEQKSEKESNYFSRSVDFEIKKPEQMLQSVLYYVYDKNTQYWLTPFLYKLLDSAESLTSLEYIDNILSMSDDTLRTIGWDIMTDNFIYKKLELNFESKEIGYPNIKRYWFQKLEYILWKNWKDRNDPKFKSYRITSKNSVEHVFPQNEEYKNKIPTKTLHCFGNLGLLNVSQNSSYSHQKVDKKKIDFKEKSTYDSLKLYHLYLNKKWEEDVEFDKIIDFHHDQMLNEFKKYYKDRIINVN